MLCTKEKPKINYDSKFDVLYYNVKESDNDYSADTNGNIETFRDMETDEVTGYIVFNFKDICKNKTKEYSLLRKIFDIPTVAASCGFWNYSTATKKALSGRLEGLNGKVDKNRIISHKCSRL